MRHLKNNDKIFIYSYRAYSKVRLSTKIALNKIQCVTRIKILHVSTPECHLQGII